MTLRLRRRSRDGLHAEQAALTARLAEAFGFSDDDLYRNQTGGLSRIQRQRLHHHAGRLERRGAWLIVSIAAAVMLLGGPERWPMAVGLLALYGLVWGGVGLLRRHYTPLARDLRAETVICVQGRINFRFPVRKRDTYDLQASYAMVEINGEGFRISPAQYIALYRLHQQDPHQFYAVYYLPHARTVLSIEPIIVNVEHFFIA
ncbi:MAG: hypothetical protein ACLFTK_14320 [Anaerolineales bacterium]